MSRRIYCFVAAVLLLTAVLAAPAGAAYYRGADIDGILFDGNIVFWDEEIPVKAVFSGYQVTIYWEDGTESKYLLESQEIEFPDIIEIFGDPEDPKDIGALLQIYM